MNGNIAISSGLHILIVIITAMSLPFLSKKPLDLPPIISVELIQITDQTSIPFAKKEKPSTDALERRRNAHRRG